jgi:hypothetical protein
LVRLIEQQQIRFADQRAEPAARAGASRREGCHADVSGQTERGENLLHRDSRCHFVSSESPRGLPKPRRGLAGVLERSILRQPSDAEGPTPSRRSLNLADGPADHMQQRRFARAVAADEADTLARIDLHADIVEQRQVTVSDGNVIERRRWACVGTTVRVRELR